MLHIHLFGGVSAPPFQNSSFLNVLAFDLVSAAFTAAFTLLCTAVAHRQLLMHLDLDWDWWGVVGGANIMRVVPFAVACCLLVAALSDSFQHWVLMCAVLQCCTVLKIMNYAYQSGYVAYISLCMSCRTSIVFVHDACWFCGEHVSHIGFMPMSSVVMLHRTHHLLMYVMLSSSTQVSSTNVVTTGVLLGVHITCMPAL